MNEILKKVKEMLLTQKSVSFSDGSDEFKIINKLFYGYGYDNHDEDDNRTDGWFDHVHDVWINKELGLIVKYKYENGDTWTSYEFEKLNIEDIEREMISNKKSLICQANDEAETLEKFNGYISKDDNDIRKLLNSVTDTLIEKDEVVFDSYYSDLDDYTTIHDFIYSDDNDWFDGICDTWINKDMGLMIKFYDNGEDYAGDDFVCTYTITKFDEDSANGMLSEYDEKIKYYGERSSTCRHHIDDLNKYMKK